MVVPRSAFMFACLVCLSATERVKLQAKRLINGRVIANGYSVSAKSLSQCIENCNEREETCDGVVYHEIIGKCRLIDKCVPAYQVDNSSSVVYYSRRPQIKSRSYVHEPKTDSCLGLIVSSVDYPSAETLCAKQNAHLAVLSKKYLNNIGRDLLSNSSSDWAWIKYEDIAYREESKRWGGISGNDVLSGDTFSSKAMKRQNDSGRSCWGLNKLGKLGQFPCKNATMFVLCQVSKFGV